jgi:hypothetical protein
MTMSESTHLTHDNLMDELSNVAQNQPLWPGDTVSHAGADELCRLGLIKRSGEGNNYWVLTDDGLRTYLSMRSASAKQEATP